MNLIRNIALSLMLLSAVESSTNIETRTDSEGTDFPKLLFIPVGASLSSCLEGMGLPPMLLSPVSVLDRSCSDSCPGLELKAYEKSDDFEAAEFLWIGNELISVNDFKTGMCEGSFTSIHMDDGRLCKKDIKYSPPNFVEFQKRIENQKMRVYWRTEDNENKYPTMEGLLFSYTKSIGENGGTYELPLLNDLLPLEENCLLVQIAARQVFVNNGSVFKKMYGNVTEGMQLKKELLDMIPQFAEEFKILKGLMGS